jgi:hypothetical protein
MLAVAGVLLTDPITASALATHALATHAVTRFTARAAVVGIRQLVHLTTVVVLFVAVLETLEAQANIAAPASAADVLGVVPRSANFATFPAIVDAVVQRYFTTVVTVLVAIFPRRVAGALHTLVVTAANRGRVGQTARNAGVLCTAEARIVHSNAFGNSLDLALLFRVCAGQDPLTAERFLVDGEAALQEE